MDCVLESIIISEFDFFEYGNATVIISELFGYIRIKYLGNNIMTAKGYFK